MMYDVIEPILNAVLLEITRTQQKHRHALRWKFIKIKRIRNKTKKIMAKEMYEFIRELNDSKLLS